MKRRKREISKLKEGRVVKITWDDASVYRTPGTGLIETYDVGIVTLINEKFVELSQSWNIEDQHLGHWTSIPLSIIKRVRVID